MRGRSTLILLIVATALGGYVYFVESRKPIEDENAKKKVFAYDSGKIEQIEIKLANSESTVLKKDAGAWTIVKPVSAPADQNNVNDIVTNLATLEEDRVVEDNAADLKSYIEFGACGHIDLRFVAWPIKADCGRNKKRLGQFSLANGRQMSIITNELYYSNILRRSHFGVYQSLGASHPRIMRSGRLA